MPLRATVNQNTQIGLEATPGTGVPANRLLEQFTVQFGPKMDVTTFRAQGRKYPSSAVENWEMVEGKFSGDLDYNGLVYQVNSWLAPLTPAAATTANIAYTWAVTPATTGNYSPKTFTIQHGDSVRAESASFGLFSGFSYKIQRKSVATTESPFFAQALTDGVTLTASPTTVGLLPAVGKHFNVYLDTTSAGIGVTQLLAVMEVAFDASGYYGQFFPLNRTNVSFSDKVDLAPKNTLKIKLEADTQGMSPLSSLQLGSYLYARVAGVGGTVEQNQTVGVGAASGGNFTLTYKGQTTPTIAFNALNSVVATALQGLSTIGATGCTVTGTAPTWLVTFTGALAQDPTLLTGSGAGLTGGALTITAAPVTSGFTHDMAVKVVSATPLADSEGVYAIEWEFEVAEDPAWNTGQAQKLSGTCTLASL